MPNFGKLHCYPHYIGHFHWLAGVKRWRGGHYIGHFHWLAGVKRWGGGITLATSTGWRGPPGPVVPRAST